MRPRRSSGRPGELDWKGPGRSVCADTPIGGGRGFVELERFAVLFPDAPSVAAIGRFVNPLTVVLAPLSAVDDEAAVIPGGEEELLDDSEPGCQAFREYGLRAPRPSAVGGPQQERVPWQGKDRMAADPAGRGRRIGCGRAQRRGWALVRLAPGVAGIVAGQQCGIKRNRGGVQVARRKRRSPTASTAANSR